MKYLAMPVSEISCRTQSTEEMQAGISDFTGLRRIQNHESELPLVGREGTCSDAWRPRCLRTTVKLQEGYQVLGCTKTCV